MPAEAAATAATPYAAALATPAPVDGIELREYERLTNVALTPEQAAVLRRHFSAALTVQRAWEGPGFDLTASGCVGNVFVGDLRLRILPKVPLTNLFYMLTYTPDLVRFRDEVTRLGAADDVFEFIVRIFTGQVEGLVRQGIVRGYVEWEDGFPFLRGRLLLGEHLRRTVTQPGRFHQRAHDFTADLRENRILKATLAKLARLDYDNRQLRSRLRHAYSAFSEVTFADIRPEECDRVIYTRLNRRYRSPLVLARLLLQRLSLEGHAGDTRFAAFLLPVAEVFEGFVSGLLREQLAGHPHLSVRPQARYLLDTDGRVPGEPDNLLLWDGRPRLVLDTKYKVYGERPKPADFYQMLAYCHKLGLDRGLLVYPADPAPGERFRFTSGVTVVAEALPLDGPLDDFRARCAAWARALAAEVAREIENS